MTPQSKQIGTDPSPLRRWTPLLLAAIVCLVVSVLMPTTGAHAASGATIAGRLVTSSQVPAVGGITISVQPVDSQQGALSTITADDGQYQIGGVPPGEYLVQAEDRRPSDINSGVTAQWYGGVPSNIHGTTVTLVEGQTKTLVNWSVNRGSTLHGSFHSVCAGPNAVINVQLENSPQYPPYPFQAAETAYPIEASSTEYTIKGVLYGSWRVRVTVTGQGTCTGFSDPVYLTPGDRELGDLPLRRIGGGIDFNGDTTTDQIVRTPAGDLRLYPGDGSGGWGTPSTIGTGWNSMNALLNITGFGGEAEPDLLGRDDAGSLWMFRGDRKGAVSQYGQRVGTGWQGMTAIFSPGDFDGDGEPDVIARNGAGSLLLYPGNGHGGWGTPSTIGQGWNVFDKVLAGDDFNGDGNADILGRTPNGDLLMYPGDGSGGFQGSSGILVGTGWQVFSAVVNAGDFDGDSKPDLLARNPSGNLIMYRGNARGGWLSETGTTVGYGWDGLLFLD
jgi:hypothetical protein